MDDVLRILIQWLHVTAGILWIGAGAYTLMVQLPALAAMPLPARGPALAALGPRQLRYVLRLAEVTIALGFVNLFTGGRARELTEPFASRWPLAMLVGILLALGLYASIRAVAKPLIERLLAAAPQAAAGDAAAAAQVPVLRERIRRVATAQVTVGIVIVLAMVTARFS